MKNTLPAEIWIPPLLKFYDTYEKEGLYIFLTKLDNKFSYDWISQATPTQRIENMNSIIKEIEASECVEDVLSSKLLDIDFRKLEEILNLDIYKRRFAKYILFKIDYILSGHDEIMNIPKTVSVEHILPQNPKDDSQWIKDFTKDDREKWTNMLGNLVLISRRKNSSQGRSDYTVKKKKYFEKNIELFRNSINVLNNNDKWTPSELIKNHKEVIELLKKHYAI